jgi:hypothetical protein
MGLFLDLLGFANADSQTIELALSQYFMKAGGSLIPDDTAWDDLNTITIADNPNNKVSLVHAGSYTNWNSVAAYISSHLAIPVFYFHIHDDALWMYTFYVNGLLKDQFNPLPDYWDDDISEEERKQNAGNVKTLCTFWPNAQPRSIQNYLKPWELDGDDEQFAYSRDLFPQGDAWQVTDFMHQLGLRYPFDDTKRIAGHSFRLNIPNAID